MTFPENPNKVHILQNEAVITAAENT